VIERAVIFAKGSVIQGAEIALQRPESANRDQSFRAMKSMVIAQFEKDYIQELLHVHGGSVSKAARAAQKNRRAFWELIRKHKVDVQQFRPNALREKRTHSAVSLGNEKTRNHAGRLNRES
jgi:DNA-binding NtrC family response regulator